MAYGDNFKIFGPYSRRNDNRKIVIVVERNGKRRTISYPKFLVELQVGHKLNIDQTVDHINGDINDNRLDNLQLLERAEHSKKDTRRVKLIKFHCAWCDKEFERSPRLIRDKAKKGKAGPFCCREHAGKYSRNLQLKLIDKFKAQPMIDSEYYNLRDKTASVMVNVTDIFIDNFCDIWEE